MSHVMHRPRKYFACHESCADFSRSVARVRNEKSKIRKTSFDHNSPKRKRATVVRWKGRGAPTRFMDFTRPPPSPVVGGVGLRGLSGSSSMRFDSIPIYIYIYKAKKTREYRPNDYTCRYYTPLEEFTHMCVAVDTRVSAIYRHISI